MIDIVEKVNIEFCENYAKEIAYRNSVDEVYVLFTKYGNINENQAARYNVKDKKWYYCKNEREYDFSKIFFNRVANIYIMPVFQAKPIRVKIESDWELQCSDDNMMTYVKKIQLGKDISKNES